MRDDSVTGSATVGVVRQVHIALSALDQLDEVLVDSNEDFIATVEAWNHTRATIRLNGNVLVIDSELVWEDHDLA